MEEKKVTDHDLDRDREHTWFCLSKAVAIIAVVCGTIAFGWILSAPNEEAMLRRAEIATPLGMAFAAALTFTTVVWRGLVGEFQAREQKRANDQKDEETSAGLLLEGAKLISTQQKGQIVAGIAALDTVISSGKDKLAKSAINLLADFVAENHQVKNLFYQFIAANLVMKNGEEQGVSSDREIIVEDADFYEAEQTLYGFSFVTYRGCRFHNSFSELFGDKFRLKFENCELKQSEINDLRYKYARCSIVTSTVKVLRAISLLSNTFTKTDFSNAILGDREFSTVIFEAPEKRFINCFYYHGSPPVGQLASTIIPYLEVRDRRAT